MTDRRAGGLLVLLSGRGAALTANRMLIVVVPWLVLVSTGSPAKTGLVALCQILPWVIMQVLAGPILDRVAPHRVSACGDAISAAAVTALAVCGTPPLWLIAVLMAAVGAADGPANAAKTILLPPVAADAGVPLIHAAGWSTAVERSAGIGLVGAGLLTAVGGPTVALWCAAALFATATLFSAAIRARPARSGTTGTYLQQVKDGVAFLRGDRSLRALISMFAVTNMLDQALLGSLFLVWARRAGYDTTVPGLAMGLFAGTGALTAVAIGRYGSHLNRRTVYLTGFLIAGVSRFIILAIGGSSTAVLVVFAVAGLGSGCGNPIVEAVQYEHIPGHLQGRVRTQIVAGAWLGMPFGGLVAAGLLAAGLPVALWACGIAYLLAVLYPGWRVTWQPTTTAGTRSPSPGQLAAAEHLHHPASPRAVPPSSGTGQRIAVAGDAA